MDHGTVSGAKSEGDYYGLGDDVFVSCDDGYRVEGSDILFCEENGEWDADPPQCVGKCALLPVNVHRETQFVLT